MLSHTITVVQIKVNIQHSTVFISEPQDA